MPPLFALTRPPPVAAAGRNGSAPMNPPDAEQVAEVLVVPPDEAARMFTTQGGPEFADLYLLAARRRAKGVP